MPVLINPTRDNNSQIYGKAAPEKYLSACENQQFSYNG